MIPRRWKVTLQVVFYSLLLIFLARYLRGTDWTELARLHFNPLYLLAAVPFSIGSRLLQPIAWSTLIRGYGDRPPDYPQLTRVYATSWMGRYIPGKVAWIGAKILLGREHGVRAATLAATSVAEAALQLSAALALALVLILAWGDALVVSDDMWTIAVIALVAMSILLTPPVFNRLTAWARSVVTTSAPPADAGHISLNTLLVGGALYIVIHAMSGPPIWFALKSIYPAVSVSLMPELTAAVLLAGTLGTLALFAPAGLGVREGILIVLIGVLVPKSIAVAAVVLLRIWSIGMDVLYYAVAVILDRSRPRRAP
jgi:uncharacterized membrane protein YbhN (UPF0104 family)